MASPRLRVVSHPLGKLTNEHKAVLKHTNCYEALCNEKFEDVTKMSPYSGYSGIVIALRNHFGWADTDYRVRKNRKYVSPC